MNMRTVLLALVAVLVLGAPAQAATARPDLAVTTATEPPSELQPGSAFSATYKVQNKGGARARTSTLGILLSTDGKASADDVLVASQAVRAIRAKSRATPSVRIVLPVTLPAGRFSLLACADQRAQVRESRENNNCKVSRFALTVRKADSPPPAPDTTAPTAPALTGTVPAVIGADASPLVRGTAEPGSRVRLYVGGACSDGAAAATTADTDGSFAAGVPVPTGAVSAITATATDAAGNTSGCSTPLSYEQDDGTPAAPVISGTTPVSPGQDVTPTFRGTAEPSAIVALYAGVACNGAFIAQVVADINGAWDIDLGVTPDDTTQITATATDPAGHTSLCSLPQTYRHDATPPAAAAITATTPSITGNNPTPTLAGTAEPGADVLIYQQAACAGPVLTTVTASVGGAWSTPVAAAPNGARTWSARARDAAGNTALNCSNAKTYTHDDVAPSVPAFDSPATTPPSPSPDASPVLHGTGDPGSIIRLYDAADCVGSAFFTTVAVGGDGTWSVELILGEPAQNTTITFSIRGSDSAGNLSACAPAPAVYRHDNVGPAVTGVQWPASPGSATTVTVSGTTEPNADVFVFGGQPLICTQPLFALKAGKADAQGDFTLNVTLGGFFPPEDGEQNLGVAARDAAGNLSGCQSFVYVLDTQVSPPDINSPATPGGDEFPTVGGGAEPGAEVKVFVDDATCSGVPFATLTADEGGGWSVTAPAVATTASYTALQTDLTGNTSGCSNPWLYERDTTPPPAPTLTDTFPASGGDNSNPYVRGTAEDGANVTIYGSATCEEGTEVGGGQGGAGFTYPGIQVFVPSGTTTTLSAKATDLAGNVSGCSNTISYTDVDP